MPVPPDPPRARLDRKELALDTVVSIASALASSALGADWLGSLICAALAPAILTYARQPGPDRRRRTAIGLALLALLHAIQAAIARVRGYRVKSKVARGGHGLRFAELTALLAFAISVVLLTGPELMLGDAIASDRRLTLFPIERDGPPRPPPPPPDPTATPNPTTTPDPTAIPDPTPTPDPTATPDSTATPDPTAVPSPTVEPPDRTAPELDLPADITARSGAAVRYRATAADKIDGPVAVSCRPASGSRFPIGTTTVHCTARDRAGNTAAGDFAVRVLAPPDPTPSPTPTPTATSAPTPPPDTIAPVFTPRSRTIIVDSNEQRGTPVAYPFPPATDDRDPVVDVTCVPATVPAGTRDGVSCTAADDAGNEAHLSALVYIRIP